MTRIVVLADTHLRHGSRRRLPAEAYRHLEQADVILHAGDLVIPDVLEDLAQFAPVHAVLGNNDHELVGRLPVECALVVDGVAVAMVHDSGPAAGRSGRMRKRFPAADVVVFGHSHIPWDEMVDGQLLLNPGSLTERRRQPAHTLATLGVEDGRILHHTLEVV